MQSNGVILSVNDQTSAYVSLTTTYSDKSYQLSLEYSTTNLQTTSSLFQTFSLTSGFWIRISWSLSFSTSTLTLLSNINNKLQQQSSAINYIYNQPASTGHPISRILIFKRILKYTKLIVSVMNDQEIFINNLFQSYLND